MPTVILAFFYGQSRIFFTVARDGLLPRTLARVSQPRNAGADHDLHRDRDVDLRRADPADSIAALANAGTLAAFVAVCAAMLVLRRREPDRERKFRAPAAWLVGIFGILGCLYLFISLPNRTQLFFLAAQVIGLVLYAIYGTAPRAPSARQGRCLHGRDRPSSSRLKNIVGGSAGNLVEWFDWYVYSAPDDLFRAGFFPKEDPTAQLLSAAAIFAVGFLMRPIGAWLMGIYSDRHGRKSGLTLSVALMAGGSLLIAAAPTYAQAGPIAPAVLVLARMLQGLVGRRRIWRERDLFVGNGDAQSPRVLGELPVCHADRRAASRAGALSFCCKSRCPKRALQAWGWRVAFGVGAVLAFVGLCSARRGSTETESSTDQSRGPSRILDARTCGGSIRASS